MIEAFANHLGSHIGRHLFYWATTLPASSLAASTDTESEDGFNLRITNLINKFHGPIERGVQILDHLLTLEEEDFNDHWGSAYVHNYVPEIVGRSVNHHHHHNVGGGVDVANQEVLNSHDNNAITQRRQNIIVRGNSK